MLPNSIKYYRKLKKLAAAEVAAKLGIQYATYNSYETGSKPVSKPALNKLEDILGVKTEKLLEPCESESLERNRPNRLEQLINERNEPKLEAKVVPVWQHELDKLADRVAELEAKKVELAVSKPAYYTDGKIEVIDFIADKHMDFWKGNAIKYISRAGKKDPAKYNEDISKAIWYLTDHVMRNGGGVKLASDVVDCLIRVIKNSELDAEDLGKLNAKIAEAFAEKVG